MRGEGDVVLFGALPCPSAAGDWTRDLDLVRYNAPELLPIRAFLRTLPYTIALEGPLYRFVWEPPLQRDRGITSDSCLSPYIAVHCSCRISRAALLPIRALLLKG